MAKVVQYFLGVHSPQGYVSRFDQLGEPGSWRCWVVMGGAAATRSDLIGRVRRELEGRCPVIEELLCSDAPSALDGAIFPGLFSSIIDGEPPKNLRLRYPGVYEQPVTLWDCLDRAAIWNSREEIFARGREADLLRKDAEGYLYAAGALMGDLASIGAAALDREKLLAYARGLAAREFSRSSRGTGGREKVRFVSAVTGEDQPLVPHNGRWEQEKVRFVSAITGEGKVLLRDTIAAAAPRIIAIEDNWGAASNALLEALRELAIKSGNDVVACRCPLFPFTKLDHLLLPGLGLGFVTVNHATAPALSGLWERAIHASRFTDSGLLRKKRERSAFLRKAASGMLEQAAQLLGQAAAARRKADDILLEATDQKKVERVTERVIEEMSR